MPEDAPVGCNRLLGSARCPSHESDHLIGGSYPTEGNVKSVQARLVHLLAERRASIANHYRLKATIGGFAGSGRHADVTRHPGHGHPLRALMTEPLFEARGGERSGRNLVEHQLARQRLQRFVNLPARVID